LSETINILPIKYD